MKKLGKCLKYIPMIYVLCLPINFFIHVYGVHTGIIMPVFMNMLDFLRVPVIATFSYYIAKTHTKQEKKHPSERLMIFAGISFVEWIINIVISDIYVETYYDHIYFLVFFCITTGVGYLLETNAFYTMAESVAGITADCWLVFNIVLVIMIVKLYGDGEKGISNVIIGAISLRALIRGGILWEYLKKRALGKVSESIEET